MSNTFAISAGDTCASLAVLPLFRFVTEMAEAARPLPRHMPASIPSDQVYYWSAAWQHDVRESVAALEAGDYVDFVDPDDSNDIVRWFLGDDE